MLSPSCKPLIPIILSRIFEQLEEKVVQEACLTVLNTWYTSGTQDDTTRALQALSAIFQARPGVGSSILQSPGMIDEIAEVLEFKQVHVQLATLEALSSACGDKVCRALIVDKCGQLLVRLSKSTDTVLRSAALSAIIKAMVEDKELERQILTDKLVVGSFTDLLKDPNAQFTAKLSAVESLAYLSVHADVKEELVSDVGTIKALLGLVTIGEFERSAAYGVATILANITGYKKRLTEEEEQIQKLRVMAKDIVQPDVDPRNEEGPTEKRGKIVTNAGVTTSLVLLAKSGSQNIKDVTAQIFLNITINKANRGLILQQGGVKALINLFATCSPQASPLAGQALAKIAISSDPNIAFPGQTASELVRPFVTLCNGDGPLRQFEALMALTNLASMSTNEDIRGIIIGSGGVKAMEMLQFSDNAMIQRAATEALCNMMFEPEIFDSYASATSTSKLKIFIALCDAEDAQTRRAASGVLAILSSHPNVCKLMQDDERGMEIILGLCEDKEAIELCHRGIECLKNMCVAGGDIARNVVMTGGIQVLKNMADHRAVEVSSIAVVGIEALKKLASVAE